MTVKRKPDVSLIHPDAGHLIPFQVPARLPRPPSGFAHHGPRGDGVRLVHSAGTGRVSRRDVPAGRAPAPGESARASGCRAAQMPGQSREAAAGGEIGAASSVLCSQVGKRGRCLDKGWKRGERCTRQEGVFNLRQFFAANVPCIPLPPLAPTSRRNPPERARSGPGADVYFGVLCRWWGGRVRSINARFSSLTPRTATAPSPRTLRSCLSASCSRSTNP